MSPTSRLAGLSVDVDSIAVHLRGYGIEDAPYDGASYRIAIPRMLEVFGSVGARATFFLIAEEAIQHPEVVRTIVESGHEVGCHSLTHRLPFDVSDPERIRREIGQAKALLEDLSGGPVVGFRAPSWGVNSELFSQLRTAGFRYDASSFPSWVLFALRWSVARRSSGGSHMLRSSIKQGLLERPAPHVVRHPSGWSMVEVPVCTAPVTRLPYYHTMSFLLPPAVFRAIGGAARRRGGGATYIFHAVDFLDVEADRLDPRIGRHPGMNRRLDEKIALARRCLADLGRRHGIVPLREIADAMLGG